MRYAHLLSIAALTLLPLNPASARDKDLRTMTEAEGETEVGFCSRPSPDKTGMPGHAFVIFSAQKPGGGRDFRAIGHTIAAGTSTAAAALTYFGGAPVAGKQMEERYTSIKQNCLAVKVDRSAYDNALAAVQPTLTALGMPADVGASAESYSLKDNDCIAFAEKVANSLKSQGLKVPARDATDTPASWIKKLIAANS